MAAIFFNLEGEFNVCIDITLGLDNALMTFL